MLHFLLFLVTIATKFLANFFLLLTEGKQPQLFSAANISISPFHSTFAQCSNITIPAQMYVHPVEQESEM